VLEQHPGGVGQAGGLAATKIGREGGNDIVKLRVGAAIAKEIEEGSRSAFVSFIISSGDLLEHTRRRGRFEAASIL